MLYFAYGSNLDWTQMSSRCPSARFVCVARLPAHRLAFTRWSPRRQCGTADVVAAAGETVWGVAYDLAAADFVPLDEYEGCIMGQAGNAYDRIETTVFRDGATAQPVTAWIYVVCAKSAQ